MKSRILALILTAAALLSLLSFGASADGDSARLSAVINKNGKYIELTAAFSASDVEKYSGVPLSLFAVAPGSYIGEAPALESDIKVRSSMTFQADPEDGRRCAFVLGCDDGAGGFTPVTNYAYVTNPDVTAKYDYEYPAAKSKKGLDISLFADAQLLGVSHTVIKLPLNEYVKENSSGGVSYKCGGTTYFFDKNKIALLDYTVKTYSDAGIRIYLQLVLTKHEDGQPAYFYCEECSDDASYYAINANSGQACGALYALVSFLSEKYTSPDGEGFCGSYILGCEVNSNRLSNNAGPMSLSEYTELYAKALRTVDCAARSVYANSRVYVSVANNLNRPSYDDNADPTLDFSVADLLSHLADRVSVGGNIPWGVSVDPYNANRETADFRGAPESEYSYDAKYLTMDNINILTSLLSQPAYLYNGERRRVIIGEIGFPSGSNSEDGQKAQAAAYALAYYKAAANDQIDAIIYAAQTDSVSDGGNFGLYTRAEGTNDTAAKQKSIYHVFRYIDTDYSSVVTEPYLTYYGLTTWGEAVSGYNASAAAARTVISGSAVTEAPSGGSKLVRATDFNGTELYFYPSENARLITTEKDVDAAKLYGSEYSLIAELNEAPQPEYRGVSSNREYDLSGAGCAVLDMKLSQSGKSGTADLIFRLIGEDEDGREAVYEGGAAVVLDQYYRLYFDLNEYNDVIKGGVSRMSVWVRPHNGSENGAYKLTVNGVSFMKPGSGVTAGSVIKTVIIVLICIVVLAAAAYGIMYLRGYILYRKKKKKIEAKRKKAKG
ncbi:MAG: hypothetical protein J5879_10195 [Clostridia bacterium]|nr:hypothetical protein [Clostridia bacterium]